MTAVTAPVASSASSVHLFPAAGGAGGSGYPFPLPNGTAGRTIVNESTAALYVKFGTGASETDYTVVLAGAAAPPYAYYEFPQPMYTGPVDGIWASANGSARLTSW